MDPVNAAFCYTKATGNRFDGPERGAWHASYGDHSVATAQADVIWHLTRELEATGIYENVTDHRELLAGFTTRLHDLDGRVGENALSPDPEVAYRVGQTFAQDVLGSGGSGLLYPSTRHEGGLCLVALRPHLVQNVRPGDTWVFVWLGVPVLAVSKG